MTTEIRSHIQPRMRYPPALVELTQAEEPAEAIATLGRLLILACEDPVVCCHSWKSPAISAMSRRW